MKRSECVKLPAFRTQEALFLPAYGAGGIKKTIANFPNTVPVECAVRRTLSEHPTQPVGRVH